MRTGTKAERARTSPLVLVLSVVLGICIVIAFFVLRSQGERQEAAHKALDAIAALDSVVTSGVTYQDYAKRVADAKVSLDQFSNSGNADASTMQILSNALADYQIALELWGKDVEGTHFLGIGRPGLGQDLTSRYDLASAQTNLLGRPCIDIERARSVIWLAASSKVKQARGSIP